MQILLTSPADRPPSCPTKRQSSPNLPNNLNQSGNRHNLLRPRRMHSNPEAQRQGQLMMLPNLRRTLNNRRAGSNNHRKTVGAGIGSDPGTSTGKDLRDKGTDRQMALRGRLKRNRQNLHDRYNKTNRDPSPRHPSRSVGNNSNISWISASLSLSTTRRSRSRSYINSYAQHSAGQHIAMRLFLSTTVARTGHSRSCAH